MIKTCTLDLERVVIQEGQTVLAEDERPKKRRAPLVPIYDEVDYLIDEEIRIAQESLAIYDEKIKT